MMTVRQRNTLLLVVGCLVMQVAAASNGLISGRVRHADTGAPIPLVQAKLTGATLARHENSNLIQKLKPDGRYQFNVPAGRYDLWVTAPDFEEAKFKINLAGDATIERNIDLHPRQRSPYRVETLALPQQMIGEVSGVAFTPKGTLVVTTRRGEVWMRDYPSERWHRFAYGLYEGFGLVANSESEVIVIQRPEFTRLRDTDGDRIADVFETIADEWGITGNYHEFSYGLARDSAGNIYAASGMSSYRQSNDVKWVRGPVKTEQFMPWPGPGPIPDGHRSVALYQGWALQATADGKLVPFASGFRQPLGVAVSPNDELFISDCPGAWIPTATFTHVEKGAFYGHPDGLKWHPELKDKTMTLEQLAELRQPPSVYLPRGSLGTSPGQPVWDVTEGKFGPFRGQVFMGDVSSLLVRIDLEKVAGAYQGAVFPFLRGQGLRIGGMHNAFGPDGALYIGQTVRGWMPTEGNEGIQRIVWTGENPTEINTLRLADNGFRLTFTEPMATSAAEPKNFQIRRFHYSYHALDGSLRIDEVEVPVTSARLADDGRSVDLELLEVQPSFVYELIVSKNVESRTGHPLLNGTAYYTLNRTVSGETKPGPSRLTSATQAQLLPGDATRGADTFRLNCAVCHQADGRGSNQAGTPDFTVPGGTLAKSDDELIAIITNGIMPTPPKVNPMPPWGNVLPPQAIRDVLAYLRETFDSPQ